MAVSLAGLFPSGATCEVGRKSCLGGRRLPARTSRSPKWCTANRPMSTRGSGQQFHSARRDTSRALAISRAGLIVVLGRPAREAVERYLSGVPGVRRAGTLIADQNGRLFAFLPHPASYGPGKSFAESLPMDLPRLRRAALRSQ